MSADVRVQDPREHCRLCDCSFKVQFGNISCPGKKGYLSSENLFKPSQRKDSLGVILAEICKDVGIPIERDNSKFSDKVCNPCARKIRNLNNLYHFVKRSVIQTPKKTPVKGQKVDGKRSLETPDKKSPSWRKSKVSRTASPSSRSKKSLNFVEREADQEKQSDSLSSSYLNIDDLQKEGQQIKVLLLHADGSVSVRIPRDDESQNVIKHIVLKNWKTAANSVMKHKELLPEIKSALQKEIANECESYMKSGCLLQSTEPEELAAFNNKIFVEEVRIHCPFLYASVLGATGLDETEMKNCANNINAAALSTSTLIRLRNNSLSALHYRISTILFHSGTRFEDIIRLNRLGICMSPDSIVRLQRKMENQLEGKIKVWKKVIEENKGALLLLKEIKAKQCLADDESGMDICSVNVDISKDTIKQYEYFTEESYASFLKILASKNKENNEDISLECLDDFISDLQNTRLPLYRIVGDNVDLEIQARIQTKSHGNQSIHWTHQYAIKDRVQDPSLDDKNSQRSAKDVQFVELLPDKHVQSLLLHNFAVLISRVITKYLKVFQSLSNVVVKHIPHSYSKEMSSKSEICSLKLLFLNPNVSGEMAQILMHNQDNYVPCLSKGEKKVALSKVPLHGDQLFEERERNVKWTFRDGIHSYEKFDAIETEFADWHAKYTLYKEEFKMFFKHSSAAEIGTTKASINRTGKSNAAKGPEKHFNEYSEFHTREVEAHICASFMQMVDMKKMDDEPNLILPDSSVAKQTKAKWLIDICKDHVKKFVFDTDEIESLVQQTNELQLGMQTTRWKCRQPGCEANYAFHSGRVRHENEMHSLSFDDHTSLRDSFGYFFCRMSCGEVFKTKTTRNRHEQKKHGQLYEDETEPPSKVPKEDYKFNYHSSKLTFGLILLEFQDTIKEGDGERLMNLYKLLLLIYKNTGHYKYAYAVLLYLIKCKAFLSPAQALSLKWNRFYNSRGIRGANISLDLKKEQQNRVLKTLWRALGANLDESNAERTAGCLESLDLIYNAVDKDCMKSDQPGIRSFHQEAEAVHQITMDLMDNEVFNKTPGRIAYQSFPEFKRSILHGLDYRDLHKWLKEHIELWASIYE